jgi:hypothetical protein
VKSTSVRRNSNLRKAIRKSANSNKKTSNFKRKAKNSKKAKLQIKKTKILRDLPINLHDLKSKKPAAKIHKKKKVSCFLSDSEFETNKPTTQVKCFRPKNINENGKSKLLNLIRKKTERSSENITKLNKATKKPLQWQFDTLRLLRSKAQNQRVQELNGLFQFEQALDEIEMQILLVPTK